MHQKTPIQKKEKDNEKQKGTKNEKFLSKKTNRYKN